MNLCADRLLAVIEIDAIKKEIELLRDQYFYEPQHADFNAFFYEYLEEVNRDGQHPYDGRGRRCSCRQWLW